MSLPGQTNFDLSDRCQAFEPTRWTFVLQAARNSPDATQAFEHLAAAYWRPLYNYVRRRGYQPADAEDLTQEFFGFLLRTNPLEHVDPGVGRFRGFLLVLLRNFLANKWDHANAQKRGGGRKLVSWDNLQAEEQGEGAVSACTSPEEAFDKDWADALVRNALQQLKQEYAVAGRAALFEKLQLHLVPSAPHITHAQTARSLGMSEDAVKMSAMRLRRRFQALLRNRVSETVASPGDIEDELRHLSALWISQAP